MKRIFLIIVVAIVVFGGIAVVLLNCFPARERRLQDGTKLRLEKVSFGKEALYTSPDGWAERLRAKVVPHLPKALARYFPSPPVSAPAWRIGEVGDHPNADALNIWVSHRESASGDLLPMYTSSVELLDQHGCCLAPSRVGGEGRLPPSAAFPGLIEASMNSFRFEAFPRHEKTFRLRIKDGSSYIEFSIVNPAYVPPPTNTVSATPLPVTVTNDDLSFTLSAITLRTNDAFGFAQKLTPDNRIEITPAIIPKFEVLERGQSLHETQAAEMELWDSDGNFASPMKSKFSESLFLCPNSPAWRLKVKFYGNEGALAASNASWTLRDVKVPAAAEFTRLNGWTNLSGARVTAVCLAGRGETVYSGSTPERSTAGNVATQGNSERGATATKTVGSMTPHLACYVSGLKDDQRLTVKAVDNQGRVCFAKYWITGTNSWPVNLMAGHYLSLEMSRTLTAKQPGDLNFLLLDIAEDAKTVDLTFCVHNPHDVEFVFKPPPR